MKKSESIFVIYYYEIQEYAREYIGRELDDSEMHNAKKSLEFGLLADIEQVYRAAIDGAIEK